MQILNLLNNECTKIYANKTCINIYMYKHRQIITSKQQLYILIQDAFNVMYEDQLHPIF